MWNGLASAVDEGSALAIFRGVVAWGPATKVHAMTVDSWRRVDGAP